MKIIPLAAVLAFGISGAAMAQDAPQTTPDTSQSLPAPQTTPETTDPATDPSMTPSTPSTDATAPTPMPAPDASTPAPMPDASAPPADDSSATNGMTPDEPKADTGKKKKHKKPM